MADVADRVLAALRVLADLTPSTEQQQPSGSIPLEWFRWLPLNSLGFFLPPLDAQATGIPQVANLDRSFAERLAAVDKLRPEQRSIRLGWLFLAGRVTTPHGPRALFQPLVTVPVRVSSDPLMRRLSSAGDVELNPLVRGPERGLLEADIPYGGGILSDAGVAVGEGLLANLPKLQAFARAAAAAAGVPGVRVVPAGRAPEEYRRGEPVVVAGVGIYAVHEAGGLGRADTLRSWDAGLLDRWTAFHSVYLDDEPPAVPVDRGDGAVDSAYPLTQAQREAVRAARTEPVTVVAGAPGTGKSHAVVAIACDAMARGESVLVAAKSDATVDALLDLFERAPGADPVVFGSAERRIALARKLASGTLGPSGDVDGARRRLEGAVARRDRARAEVVRLLTAERLAYDVTDLALADARGVAPGLFGGSADLDAVRRLLAGCVTDRWPRGWRRRRARRALDALAGSAEATPEEIAGALDVAAAAREAVTLRTGGGLDLTVPWQVLLAAEDDVHRRVADLLAADARSPHRLRRTTLPTVAALATALRSGRAARREQLRRLDPEKLTRALPLWVGALPDVDDLLPAVPAMFDLVVVDEASSVDQPLAAAALLRGRRAVVVGDPRQLRHVSFVPDADQRAAVARHGIPAGAETRLDVRRNSAFDVAAAVAPVRTLDEHFRCAPHLVAYVFDRIYEGQVQVATRTPRNEASDRITAVRVDGERKATGVVPVEVDRAMELLRTLRRDGVTSLGLMTPFRAQAEALEAAVLREFDAAAIDELGLRVGTVHAFQGNERDVVVTSLALDGKSGPNSWRFVEDPHLLAVLLTRARRHFYLLHSAEPSPGSTLAGYVAQANDPPPPHPGHPPADQWTAGVAADLSAAGVALRTGYPVGRQLVDVCIDHPARPVALICVPHPGGPDAHVERHAFLVRAGWLVLEAYRSRWEARRGELVVTLLRELDAVAARLHSGRPLA